MRELRCIGYEHLGDAGKPGRCFGSRPAVMARHEHVDITAEFARRGECLAGGRIERIIGVFGEN